MSSLDHKAEAVSTLGKFFFLAAVLMLILTLALFVSLLIVNFLWPLKYGLRRIEAVSQIYPGKYVEINRPEIILADNLPVTVTLTLINTDVLTEPVTVSVTWPSTLSQFSAPEEKTFSQTLKKAELVTVPLRLVNARTLASLSSNQSLTFTVSSASTVNNPITITRPIIIEGEWGLNIRTFINSTINERSPLVILIAGLIAATGSLLTQYFQRQMEKDKEEETRRSIEVTRNEAKELVNQFCDRFVVGDLQNSQATFNRLKDSRSAEYAKIEIDLIRKVLGLGLADNKLV